MSTIDIQRPFKSFDQHLKNNENKQILFSAAFGSGKTYFLKKYFEKEIDEFNAFWLSPVKYVVSPNEDIFEYIKIDLAFQLLKSPIIGAEVQTRYGNLLYLDQFINSNSEDIFKLLFSALEFVPDSGLSIAGNSLINILNEYKRFKDKLNKHLNITSKTIKDYLSKSIAIKGSIYEDDLISQTIRRGLEKVQQGKQNVLIIDDLDRLDPEHIFRILNILTVHQENASETNKFGFDKIIVVCHFENIRHIYEHKYGKEVDFNGYIEKYYSTDVFHFINEQAVAVFCESGLSIDLNPNLKLVLGICLNYFLRSKKITVRSIIKYKLDFLLNAFTLTDSEAVFNVNRGDTGYLNVDKIRSTFKESKFHIYSTDFDLFIVIKILTIVFGDYSRLKDALTKGIGSDSYHTYYDEAEYKTVVSAFGPIKILINYFDKPTNLAITYTRNNGYYSHNHRYVEEASLPFINFKNYKYMIDFGWTKDNPYENQVSLYSNKDFISNESVVERLIRSGETSQPLYLSSKEVLEWVFEVVDFLERRGFAHQLGIIP